MLVTVLSITPLHQSINCTTGRRLCKHCGKNYNIADIYLPASGGRPAIALPPLNPAPECAGHLETRPDDTEAVVRHRLQVCISA